MAFMSSMDPTADNIGLAVFPPATGGNACAPSASGAYDQQSAEYLLSRLSNGYGTMVNNQTMLDPNSELMSGPQLHQGGWLDRLRQRAGRRLGRAAAGRACGREAGHHHALRRRRQHRARLPADRIALPHQPLRHRHRHRQRAKSSGVLMCLDRRRHRRRRQDPTATATSLDRSLPGNQAVETPAPDRQPGQLLRPAAGGRPHQHLPRHQRRPGGRHQPSQRLTLGRRGSRPRRPAGGSMRHSRVRAGSPPRCGCPSCAGRRPSGWTGAGCTRWRARRGWFPAPASPIRSRPSGRPWARTAPCRAR